ncbi:photoreceptor cilium actin regulator [Mixophyes fleayi]|uniref:photoreceptor cilium actin regulator n=1 Tax=Mixophyes fleayi TaxID=3061075 RepID=UPI003F4E44FA
MGCSPSHSGIIQIIAKNAAKPLKKNKAILPPNHDNNGITIPLSDGKSPGCYIPNEESKQKDKLQECHHQYSNLEKDLPDVLDGLSRKGPVSDKQENYEKHGTANEGMINLSYQKRRNVRKQSSTGPEQELPISVQQEGNPRRSRKSKRSLKHGRRAKPNQIVFPEVQKKVDFPEKLVKAHQDAYAFLNPNLSKYEAVISMANQATQTHLILQQMISFMALRFDEIDQCLGEIAEDGEKLLKDVGSNLTWPLGKGDPTEQPDLLQQLLQYTVNKMQSLNCTVSSLTTNALQETCSFLQSAVDKFQEKLKQKEHHDESLLKMIKSLEDLAASSPKPHPNDLPLYSEDSGIGGDSESIRGYRTPDKMGRQASIDSSGQVCLERSARISELQLSIDKNKIHEPDVDVKSMPDLKESVKHSSQEQLSNPRVSKQTSLTSSLSTSSLASTTLEQDGTNDQESEELTSSDESYDESEDSKSVTSQITLPQRPLTSPAGTCGYKVSSKWLENPDNEAMTLKMKEAISEKIKFVPGKSCSNVWTREEVNSEVVRPSTADGSNRTSAKHRRSRSAESLRSQGEDPTLLELQRTQKELNKKLEQLYSLNGAKNKETPENPTVKSFSHTGSIILSNTTATSKLKACLDKSFNILPSQERVTMRKLDKDTAKDSNGNQNSKMLRTALHSKDPKKEDNPTSIERKIESISVSPRKSVRKLIQTFSPADDSLKITSVKALGPLRCVRKFGVPVLPPTIPACKGLQPLDNKSHILSTEDENPASTSTHLSTSTLISPFPALISQNDINIGTTESGTEDFENFPPPPLEILMDDSYNVLQTNEHEKNSNLTCPMKKTFMSQKIKTSINIKNLLPSKNATDTYTSADNPIWKKEPVLELRKYSLESGQQHIDNHRGLEIQRKHEIEQAAHLYKQSHKIIHLQNPGEGEVVRLNPDADIAKPYTPASMLKPKQSSPILPKNEKIPMTLRRTSPTRATASSEPTERKLTSPPTNKAINKTYSHVPRPPPLQKNISPTSTPRQQSPPTQKKQPNPPSQRKLESPPQIRKQQSPPSQRRLPSPPQVQRQSPPSQRRLPSPPQVQRQSPPSQRRLPSPPQVQRQSPPNQHRLPSPPSNRFEPSSPSRFTPSPPVSPSSTHKGLRRSSDDQQPPSKMIGNAQSIFCPSSSSLFEAKPPSSPCTSILETASNKVSSPVLRQTFSSCQYGDQQRRVATSAANPQPFVRRSYSDRRPKVQLRLPTSISASAVSDSALQKIGVEESARKDNEPMTSQSLADARAAGRTASHSELCVVGQGL